VKIFLAEAALVTLVTLVVMAVVFRNRRARDLLRFARNVAWGWVIAVVLLAALRIWHNGGL